LLPCCVTAPRPQRGVLVVIYALLRAAAAGNKPEAANPQKAALTLSLDLAEWLTAKTPLL
jgi:hypothetical protein